MISKLSVKKPYTVLVGIVLVIVLGVVAFTKMTADLLPSMELPYAIVLTTYPGASPEEVEMVVTKPVEQAVATINNIEQVSSISQENYSMVVLEFGSDTNMDSAALDMREKLDLVSGYWDDSIGTPTILKLNPDMMPVMVAAVDKEGLDSVELTHYVEDTLIPSIEAVNGVASVTTQGAIEEGIHVIIQKKKIDKVNEDITKSLDASFADAKRQMDDAQRDINSGKNTLASKQTEVEQQLSSATIALNDAKMDLTLKEQELTKALSEVLSCETELKEKKSQLEAGIEGLKQLKAAYDELCMKKAALDEMYKDDPKNPVYLAAIEQINSAIANLEAQVKTMNDMDGKPLTLETLGVTIQKMEAALQELTVGLTTVEEQKKQIDEGLKQISEGKVGINDKITELDKSRASANSEFSKAQQELSAGEKELDKQVEQFDETKDDAYAAADMSDIITTDLIEAILTAQNFSMPAGYITENDADYLVRVGDKFTDLDSMKNLVLMDLGMDDVEPITLNQVADVMIQNNAADTYTKVNENNGLILSISKQTNYATAEVAKSLNKKFDVLSKEDTTLRFTALMDQGLYIDMIVNSVLQNLAFGAILAIVILLMFLKDIRPTGIIAVSIPVSVVFAIVLMYFSGVTLNVISLSGLALGVGMLVDNSIVVIENIYRLRKEGMDIKEAAITGAKQVTGAIIASTLTTVSVFLPIVFTTGITRTLFTDMALTIGYSLLASLIVAITFVPVMAASTMKKSTMKTTPLFDKLQNVYTRILTAVLNHKIWVLLVAVVLLVASTYGAISAGTSLMPSMDSTQMTLTLTMPEDTKTLDETAAMSDEVINRILEIEDVDTVGAMVGGDSMAMVGIGEDNSIDTVSMYILCSEKKSMSNLEIKKLIEEKTKDLDCEVIVSASTMDMSALGSSGVVINVKGNELDDIRSCASEIAKKLEEVEGITEISDGQEEKTPEWRLSVKKDKAAEYGLTVAQVFQTVYGKLSEAKATTTVTTDGKEYSVFVEDDTAKNMTVQDIKAMKLDGTKDKEDVEVELQEIADVKEATALSAINRTNQTRYLQVTAAIDENYNVGLVSRDVEKVLEDYEAPNGVTIEFDGENESTMEALGQVLLMLVLALVFMYLIMVAQFQSLRSPFIIMFTIPLAFTGGFAGLLVSGNDVSVISMIGFVMLSGIIVNNGIVLVDSINQNREEGMSLRDAILVSGSNRLRPIIMTALTTILGLSTMALGMGMGADMAQPMAIVTIGGLLYGTLLTLLLIPCIYEMFNKRNEKKKLQRIEMENE